MAWQRSDMLISKSKRKLSRTASKCDQIFSPTTVTTHLTSWAEYVERQRPRGEMLSDSSALSPGGFLLHDTFLGSNLLPGI